MTEQRRMEYLDALGIEQFVPRRRLLGAKPSCALNSYAQQPLAQPLHADPAKVPIVAPSKPTMLQPIAPLVARVADGLTGQVAPAPIKQPRHQAVPEGMVPAQKVLRFALTVWHVPGWLWIDSRQSQQALPTDALLQNILVALGYKEPVKAEVIKWPPVESPLHIQDWPQAREMMKSFLAPRLNADERLILLGEAAYNACTQGPFDYAEHGSPGVIDYPTNTCVLLPSLSQLLANPGLKANIWRQLQKLL